MSGFHAVDSIAQDVRFGLRLLSRTPLLSVTAVLSLAIGIGAAVGVFTVADAVLFRPLSVRNPGELRSVRVEMQLGGAAKIVPGVPEEAVATIQQGADFADFIGFKLSDDATFRVDRAGSPRAARVEFVTANYFTVLGVNAQGRTLDGQDTHATPLPIVITDRLWRTLGDDTAPIGRSVWLNEQPAVVVGLTAQFNGLVADRPADVFAPISAAAAIDPTQSNFVVPLVARMHPGISANVAEEKLAALYRLSVPGPAANARIRATLGDASKGVSSVRNALEQPLILGLALVGVLVFIACANASGLLLSRFVARRGEFGIRAAIGAGRARLTRQIVVETFIVAAAAAVVGLGAGWTSAPLLLRSMPEAGSTLDFQLRLDYRLVLFTCALTLLCACGAAAAPLVRLRRADVHAILAGESRTVVAGSRRLTRVLMAAQVGCSLLLIVGAISMARTITNLRRVPLGFDASRMIVVNVNASGLRGASEMSAFHEALHQRIASAPGVERATMAQLGVLTSSSTVGTVTVPGFTPLTDEDRVSRMFFVGPDYFGTLGMNLVAGEDFSPRDFGPRTRTAIVNERFATFYFGSPARALGAIVNRDVRIVGVVADARFSSPREDPVRAMYVPFTPVQRPAMAHIAVTSGETSAVIGSVLDAVRAFDTRLHPRIATAAELLDESMAREQFFSGIAWTLSALAMMLACGGLYATVAYAVSQREAEIAVRVALGASPRRILFLVLRDPLNTTLGGIAAGVPGSWLVMRSASTLLFGVSPFDVTTVTVCAAALVCFACGAASRPAMRAVAIDALPALRKS
jgi:predicted permease